jgi:hypothetical protein
MLIAVGYLRGGSLCFQGLSRRVIDEFAGFDAYR